MPRFYWAILLGLLVCLSLTSLFWNVPKDEATARIILLQLRLPALVMAFSCGCLLSASALGCQTYFQNPLATSDFLGINSSASLGALLFISFSPLFSNPWLSHLSVFLSAFTFALVFCLVLLWVSRSLSSVLLFGIIASFFINALVSILLFFSSKESTVSFVHWTLGSFYQTSLSQSPFVLLTTLGLSMAFFFLSKPLNALLLGEKGAFYLGVDLKKTRLYFIVLVSLSSAFMTSLAGPIGFVGLVAPHLSRFMLKTENHFILVPSSMLIGAILCILADFISKIVADFYYQLPINPILSLLSFPFVLYLIFQKKNHAPSI